MGGETRVFICMFGVGFGLLVILKIIAMKQRTIARAIRAIKGYTILLSDKI